MSYPDWLNQFDWVGGRLNDGRAEDCIIRHAYIVPSLSSFIYVGVLPSINDARIRPYRVDCNEFDIIE